MKENNNSSGISNTSPTKARLQAWHPKIHGQGPFLVIFNGKVYRNEKPVTQRECPGNLEKDGTDNNPWRLVEEASEEDIAKYGNTRICDSDAKLQAWQPSIEGKGPFLVLFDNKIYKNVKPVTNEACPGNIAKEGTNNNPWCLVPEVQEEDGDCRYDKTGLKNPTSCNGDAKLEAWHPTIEGAGPFLVIFNKNIYKNVSWVAHGVCPGNLESHGSDHSPWRLVDKADPEDIKKHGDVTSCSEFLELQAWNSTLEGEGPFLAIFAGKIYENIKPVTDGACPGNIVKEGTNNNPWRFLKDATQEEMEKYGNPIHCDDDSSADM